jgi:general secretion pathway protein C
VTDGFKVFAIRKGSLFDKIGLQNNDVVKRINGVELDSAEKGLELFQALKNETTFNVDLMRKSQKTTMRFSVQ